VQGYGAVAGSALALALGSAALHAVWNLALGRARNVEAATAVTFVLSVVLATPLVVVWWSAEGEVWPYALASTLLELAYVALLAFAYRTTDVSFTYPISRGLAPVLALGFAVAALGATTSAWEVAGVAVVGVGIVLVRGLRARGDGRALVVAVLIAATIAAYTLVDRDGIRHANAITYYELTMIAPCLVYPVLVGRLGGFAALRHELTAPTLVAAAATFASFAFALAALRYASAASVLAVRSSSVVLATVLAARLLDERVSRGRVAGSVLVFAGIALLAFA
jgi:drug/metabolite transporter (DMT)-like permease